MDSCIYQVIFWILFTVIVFLALILILQKVYRKYIYTSVINSVDDAFDGFCTDVVKAVYRRQIYVPVFRGVYNKNLAIGMLDIALNTTRGNCVKDEPLNNPPGFTQQLRVEGTDPNTGQKVFYGYIFWNIITRNAVFSFTGTATPSELKSDFLYQQVAPIELNNYVAGVLVHKGFYDIYLAVRKTYIEWWRVNGSNINNLFITGHSLGAALSFLCAYDFANLPPSKPIHYAFASPRVGNREFANKFNEIEPYTLRVINTCDIVPDLPPSSWRGYIYEECGNYVPFTLALDTLYEDHVKAYIIGLPNCPEVARCNASN